jgi:hypothetical protein
VSRDDHAIALTVYGDSIVTRTTRQLTPAERALYLHH